MAASVVVAATSAVAEVVAAAVPRSEVVPVAPVVVLRVAAPVPVRVPVKAPLALVSGVPAAVREVRRGSAVAPASVRTRSAFACWTAAFRSRTLGEWPSC